MSEQERRQSEQERRRSPRVPHAFIARYRLADASEGGWLVSPLRNLSANGARFLCEREFAIGSTLEFQLQLRFTQPPIRLRARVVWIKRAQIMKTFELGVAFESTDPAAPQALEEAVRAFMQKAKDKQG